jgi:class 3 adenylate cyclase/tetratricopeptide (TPR) repeat protein
VKRFDGIVLFVDVSGFTALTESFTQAGRAGCEQLSVVIRRTFERIITCTEEAGGDVIAFAGDAIWAAWPSRSQAETSDATDYTDLVRTAAWAAKRIQARFSSDGPSDHVDIRIRIALGEGQLQFSSFKVGTERYDFLVSGTAIVDAGATARYAQPGEIVLSKSVATLLDRYARGEWIGTNAMRLDELEATSALAAGRSTPPTFESFETTIARGYLPRFLVESIDQRVFDWIAEFRTVTVLFIHLRAEASDAPPDEKRLSAALIEIQTILHRLDGERYQLLMDEKGVTCIVAFGLPFSVTEDCASRAVHAALDVEHRLKEHSVAVSIGCATGTVFCNVTGTEARRAYVMTGSALNLAARLMQVDHHGVLCDHNTRAATSNHAGLAFEALAPRFLAGRTDAVLVYRPNVRMQSFWPSHEQHDARTLIGRHLERRLLASTLSEFVASGEGYVVTLEGAAGIGKSSLLSHFATSLTDFGVERFRVAGQSLESAGNYQGIRPIFERLVAFSKPPASADEALAQLENRLSDPLLYPFLPLLSPDLPFSIPENETTQALSDEGRALRYRELYLDLLGGFAHDKRTAILVEDAHWLDGASYSFLHLAAKSIGHLLVIIATRPTDGELEASFQQILRLPHCRRVLLSPLPDDEVAALVRERLQVDSVPSQVMRLVKQRASGNPLFSLELIYALRDQDLITVDGSRCATHASDVSQSFEEALLARGLPATLQGVVSSRFDRLDLNHQLVLKVASVTAQAFSVELLSTLEPLSSLTSELQSILTRLVELEFLRVTASGSAPQYSISHALLEEAIYGSIPFEQRRSLHNAIATWHEQQGAQARPAVLAHHYVRGGQLEKALFCLEAAGAEAFRLHSFGDSARSYVRALQLFDERHGSGLDAPQQQRRGMLELSLGRAYVCWCKYTEAIEPLENGLKRLAEGIPRAALTITVLLFWALFLQIWFRFRAPKPTSDDKQREIWLAKARAYEGLTEAYFNLGKSLPCLYCALVSLNRAERAGASAELARGYSSFGAILGFVPLADAARAYCRRARSVAEAVKDRGAEAWVSVATGVFEAGIGNWNSAADRFEETARLGRLIGDARRVDDSTENQCALHYFRGQFHAGLQAADALLTSARKRDDLTMQASALRSLAYGHIWLGELDEAARRIDELQRLRDEASAHRVGLPHVDVYPLKALLAFRRQSFDEALDAAESGLRAIAAASPMFYVVVFEYAALSEVLLGLSERGLARSHKAATRVLGRLRGFARVFPIARPASLFFDGQLAQGLGKMGRAERDYSRSASLANGLELPYWEGLASARLSGLPTLTVGQRALHAKRAKELLGRLGEKHVLSTLTPTRSLSGIV